MRLQKRSHINLLVILVMLLGVTFGLSRTAQASLIDVSGENFSFDPSTGLKWLDLTQTAGLSYNAVVGGIGNTWFSEGWRYANSDEIRYLLQSNLPSLITSSSSEGDPQPGDFYAYWQPDSNGEAERLVSLLGDTYALLGGLTDATGATGIYGRQIVRLGVPEPIHSLAAVISDGGLNFLATMQGGAVDDTGHSYVGHYLVMPAAVPIPAAFWLFGSGLVGMVGFMRKGRDSKLRL